jgi:tetratricopeptide (TPR) repeat protein
MKKKIYLISLVALLVAVAGIIYNYNQKKQEDETRIYPLLERKGAMAQIKEWKDIQARANTLIEQLKADPNDSKAALNLAKIYIQEARETSNYMYYDKAAMKLVNNVLVHDSRNFNALVFKSLIFMSQHHFAEGLAAAREAQQVNPSNAHAYGLLVDGNVEMGNYDSAIANSDKMNAIRPDLTSYSRASYLREIYGDYTGAIAAMKMAVEAGGRGDEHTEWTRVQLASLYEKVGDYKNADTLYNFSLALRPDYPYALAGLARLAVAANDYGKAIGYYEKADGIVEDNSIKEELAEAYRLAGQTKKATDKANEVIENLSKDAESGNTDESIGHYGDRELAYAYLKVNNTDKALEHAMLEYNRRPDNIDVNETVAWVYYNKGEYAKALPFIKVAMRTNSKNPVLLSRAGLIYFKAGDKTMAKNLLQQASSSQAYVGSLLKTQTSAAMQTL